MNKYIKDKHIINATEKAYDLLYKVQGYVPYVEEPKKDDNNKDSAKKKMNKSDNK